ncbi:MAG: HesA/MoeB/ThiF family protein [Flavobacteriia bacterium]|nr:HesA/MoeB/ThiF family protein [Flavobacteriia bacterium]
MLNEQEKAYYSRHLQLNNFGEEAQNKLKSSKVLVIGAGGLACPCLQYLAAAGVGQLTIVDGDVVNVHNLHRQTLYSIEDIGKKKVRVAQNKLKSSNPYIIVDVVEEFLTIDNASKLFNSHDVVIDCTDNFSTRYLINDFCVLCDKPMIYGAIDQFNGQVSVFNYQIGPTYRCVFPSTPENANLLNCAEAGVLGVLPGIIGTFQAMECIKLITEIGELLNGKILFYDALNQKTVQIKVNRKNIDYQYILQKNGVQLEDYSCESENFSGKSIDTIESLNEENFILLDVRNEEEFPKLNKRNVLEIPLFNLEERINELPKDKVIVCVCKSGIRSKKAAVILQNHMEINRIIHFNNVVEKLI